MKKPFFLFVTMMCIFFATSSQLDAQIGVRAGLNLSNLSGDIEGNASKVGMQYGVVYKRQIDHAWSFTPGVIFSSKGTEDEANDLSLSLDYIEIPLDIGYALSEAFFINIGPYIGFLTSASAEGTDVKDFYKSLDFGFNFGLSYDLNPVTVGLGYGLGLTNIAETGDDDIINTNLQLYLVYSF